MRLQAHRQGNHLEEQSLHHCIDLPPYMEGVHCLHCKETMTLSLTLNGCNDRPTACLQSCQRVLQNYHPQALYSTHEKCVQVGYWIHDSNMLSAWQSNACLPAQDLPPEGLPGPARAITAHEVCYASER